MKHIEIMKLKRILVLLILLTLVASGADAQDAKPNAAFEEAEQQFRVWQTRVDDLTKEIVGDSSSVSEAEQSMYLALLAKMWWKTVPDDARKYLKKAADLVLSDFESDDKKGRPKKLKYGQRTLQIIAGLDEKLSQTIVGKLETMVMDGRDDGTIQDQEMADLFAKMGLQFVETNPSMALACGFDSLNYGVSRDAARLVALLAVKDWKLGEVLFRQALAKAKGNYSGESYSLIGSLGLYVFDAGTKNPFTISARRSYLETVADLIAGAASVEAERPNRCNIVFLMTSMLPRFDEYMPALAPVVRQQTQICIPFLYAPTRESMKAQMDGEEPRTVDESIRAARYAKDPGLKNRYFRKAMILLEDAKKYEELISLLDGMNEDEVKLMSYGWDYWRYDYAYLAALAAFESKDMPAVYRFIDKTPKRIRPNVRVRLVYKLSVVNDLGFYLENLDAMQKELGSIEITDKDLANFYQTLAGLYLKVRPTESESMFRLAVKYINKTDNDNPDFLGEKDWAPLMDYVPANAELLAIDETSINRSLANLSSRRSRVRLKLGLLESSLKKYVELKKVVEELRKAKKEPAKPTAKPSSTILPF